ncbi:ornithine decarboxylase 1B, chloroplastic-like [Aristolochia californica]|uniref:ornithine decarboxylase 1B, chloroplastic-like n=1 Tax=Aristolochia californica TaxID=171875 RepID=UPI0035DB729E
MALEQIGPLANSSMTALQAVLNAPGVRGRKVVRLGKSSETKEGGVLGIIQSIVQKQQEGQRDPFYVMDIGRVAALWEKWACSLPKVRPFYAVKCNPEPAILGALAALGSGFDCASRVEIEAVLSLDVSPDRIVYANPCKAEAHIKYSAHVGVNLTTFDSKEEINKLRKCHPRTAALLRLKALDDSGARCPLGPKYGALPEEIAPLLEAAREARINVVGVSFHVGSGASDAAAYRGAIASARHVFDTALELGLPKMKVLNIGGGFTVGPQFAAAATVISAALNSYFTDDPDLLIMAEPGRFFAETAFTLVTNIIGKRVRGELMEYWINDGIYGSMNCILYDHATLTAQPLACTSNPGNPTCKGMKIYGSTVFGPTCDALDTVLYEHQLPELQVDDWLVFPNMGAYTAAAGSNFNGFSTSAIGTHLAYSAPP